MKLIDARCYFRRFYELCTPIECAKCKYRKSLKQQVSSSHPVAKPTARKSTMRHTINNNGYAK